MTDQPGTTTESLLADAEDALHSVSLRLLAVSPQLSTPYTDAPESSPWSRTIGPQARRAHDLALTIRKHLGLPHRWATSARWLPPLTEEHALRGAVEALYMAGIHSGSQYEALVGNLIARSDDNA